MGDINSFITDELEQRWRWTVFHINGSKKGNLEGNLQDSLEESITDYVNKYKDSIPTFPEEYAPTK